MVGYPTCLRAAKSATATLRVLCRRYKPYAWRRPALCLTQYEGLWLLELGSMRSTLCSWC